MTTAEKGALLDYSTSLEVTPSFPYSVEHEVVAFQYNGSFAGLIASKNTSMSRKGYLAFISILLD